MAKHYFNDEDRMTARRMREMGKSWSVLARHFNCSDETIRRIIDPEYRRVRSERYRPVHDKIISNVGRIPPAEAERLLRTIPPDTRTPAAKFMGDPLPGRSALDKKRAELPQPTGFRGLIPANIHNSQDPLKTRTSEVAQGGEALQTNI